MNKGPLLLLLACLAAAHPGLADDKSVAATEQSDTAACVSAAMYVGELPCADCAGIETYLTLDKDGQAILTSRYLTDEPNSFTDRGAWKMKDGLVVVDFGDDTRYFKPLPDGAVMMAGADGEASAALAGAYTLKPATPLNAAAFAGVYTLRAPDNDSSEQTLTITAGNDDAATIEVQGRDCEFQGEGRIINDRIELPFKTGGPDQAAVMIIRPAETKGVLDLFTSDYDERYALNYFCRDAGSLAGEYAAQATTGAK